MIAHAMESQATLINPTPLKFKFDRNSILDATLYESSCPMYKISTNYNCSRTQVFDITSHIEHPVAIIKRREFLADLIKFKNRGTGKYIKIKHWLKNAKIANGCGAGVHFESSTGKMLWRYGSREKYRLALYPEKDSEDPVAYLDCSRSHLPLVLTVQPSVQDITEEIILSCLILEHKLRMFEKLKKHDLLYGPILGQMIDLR